MIDKQTNKQTDKETDRLFRIYISRDIGSDVFRYIDLVSHSFCVFYPNHMNFVFLFKMGHCNVKHWCALKFEI